MANIVELREMNGDKLAEMLENAREEMFNLRFQKATSRLDDYSQLKRVRREIAQLETVLHMRQLAKDTAVTHPEIAQALAGKKWRATARFNYEQTGWRVEFANEDGKKLAEALVNLNKKQSGRQPKRPSALVVSYQIAG